MGDLELLVVGTTDFAVMPQARNAEAPGQGSVPVTVRAPAARELEKAGA